MSILKICLLIFILARQLNSIEYDSYIQIPLLRGQVCEQHYAEFYNILGNNHLFHLAWPHIPAPLEEGNIFIKYYYMTYQPAMPSEVQHRYQAYYVRIHHNPTHNRQ